MIKSCLGWNLLFGCVYIVSILRWTIIYVKPYVSVLSSAPPVSPFPVINKCSNVGTGQSCNVSTLNITCFVSGYFPNISLYFRHNSFKVKELSIIQQNNTDWSRNKYVTITATASDSPYICVASDIPGLDHEQVTEVFITAKPVESTTKRMVTSSQNENDQKNLKMCKKNLLCINS